MYTQKKMSEKLRIFGIFAAVPVFVFLSVVIIPFLLGLYMTVTESTGTNISTEFVGLKNYVDAFCLGMFIDVLK